MLGTASHETRPFLELLRNMSHRFLRRLKTESIENFPRSSAGQTPAFWVLDLNETNSSGTFRNTNVEKKEPNEDRSQDDPHPEVGPSVRQSRHSIDSDPDEAPHHKYKITSETKKSLASSLKR